MRYHLLTFDLDGTLVDTASEIAEAANRTLDDFDLPRQPAADITRLIGRGTRELMLALLRQARADLDAEQMLARFDRHYGDTTGTEARVYDGCLDGLQRLREAGLRLACVTNKEERFALRVLEVTGLSGCFDLVIGGDTLVHKKPHPLPIQTCMTELGGTPATTAHVGDSRIDVEVARNAGVAAWAVPYGYNGGEAIEAAEPEMMFDDIAAVADHVLGDRLARAA